MTKKVFQVLMLTAAVWLVGSGTSQASTITKTLDYTIGNDQGDVVVFGIGQQINLYAFALVFDQVDAAFSVDVTADDQPNLANLPPGYVCVPINGGVNCIMFSVKVTNYTPTQSMPIPWTGDYTLTIAWQAPTDPLYPNTPVDTSNLGRIRILHFDSAGMTDITTPGSYCVDCKVDGDPAIGGKDDNFSDFIVVQAPAAVPEPATMVMLGTGLVLLAVRLRRRGR